MTPPDTGVAPVDVPAVSVIVVSRHRAQALTRCLQALHQQDHPRMEVIVVADPEGIGVATGQTVKSVPFDSPNIALARNAGLAVAAGDLVAFIDDDAVAEPTWASRLCAPFADPAVSAAGGYVRGRNGISYQWRGRMVDALGQHTPLDVPPQGAVIAGEPGRGVRTEGTNCAFRREVLADMGGFDPAYRFYLDDTDLNLRMAARGLVTAIVPDAQVHHGFLAGPYRRADRVPLFLHEIGASSAVFWRVHTGPDTDRAAEDLRSDQRARLLRHMITGALEPREIAPLMAELEAGLAAGKDRELTPLAPIPAGTEPFLPLATALRPGRVIAGRVWQARALRKRARAAAAAGEIVTLLLLSPTARPHRVRYADGYWEQRGGLFGPADRGGPTLRVVPFRLRAREEIARIAKFRPVGPIV